MAMLARRAPSVTRRPFALAVVALLAAAACKSNLDLGHDDRAIDPVEGPLLVTQEASPTTAPTTVPLHLTNYTAQDGVTLSCTTNAPGAVVVDCGMTAGSASDGTLTLGADH